MQHAPWQAPGTRPTPEAPPPAAASGGRGVDISVYVVLDAAVAGDRPLADIARAAVVGGATMLQLRDKTASTATMLTRARAIRAAIAGSGVPFVVNDRLDVALAAGADGVHLGQDDMPVAEARRILGPEAIIGLSIDSAAAAGAAPYDRLDYVCLQSVYATGSKADALPPIGLDGLAGLAAIVRAAAPDCPVGAIGGISVDRAAAVIRAGVDGVAVISAVVAAADAEAATASLAAAVAAGREGNAR
jgi:thiamine-phosphate pyrophosphorylase